MTKKKFAYIIMNSDYNTKTDRACFETEKMTTYIRTVRNIEEAFKEVSLLEQEGVLAIELCGAFKKENVQKIIENTKNKIAVGYSVHDKSQDDLFDIFFSE